MIEVAGTWYTAHDDNNCRSDAGLGMETIFVKEEGFFDECEEGNAMDNDEDSDDEDYETETKRFECNYCGYKSTSRLLFIQHMKKHSAGEKSKIETKNESKPEPDTSHYVKCKFCSLRFPPNIFYIHLRIGHRMGCESCVTNFESEKMLETHIDTKHSSTPYKCTICNIETFEKPLEFIRHLSAKHSLNYSQLAIECKKCERKFISFNDFYEHRLYEHGQSTRTSDWLTMFFKKTERKLSEDVFTCLICALFTKSRRKAIQHIKEAHRTLFETIFKRHRDDFREQNRNSRNDHIDSNMPETSASYDDQYNNDDYVNEPTMNDQLNTIPMARVPYTGAKHTKCHICHQQCPANMFILHLQMFHERACFICDLQLADKMYASHMQTYHHFYSLQCPLCDISSNSVNGMMIHMKENHPNTYEEIVIRCDGCDENFTSMLTLQNHRNNMHETSTERQQLDWVVTNFETSTTDNGRRSALKCVLCGSIQHHRESAMRHLKRIHREITHSCTECDHVVVSKMAFRKHMYTKHGICLLENIPTNKEQDALDAELLIKRKRKSFRSLVKESEIDAAVNAQTITDTDENTCVHCGQSYSYGMYFFHLRIVHRSACDVCKILLKKTEYLQHVKEYHTHPSGRQMYYCMFCNRNILRLTNFITHMKAVHKTTLDELSILCKKCSEKFISQDKFEKHSKTCTKEAPNRTENQEESVDNVEDNEMSNCEYDAETKANVFTDSIMDVSIS